MQHRQPHVGDHLPVLLVQPARFPLIDLVPEKVKPLQAARLLAQHHPLQHVEEGERALQYRLVRTHRGEDVVHLCDRAQDARRVHRARQVEEEQVVAAFRRQLPCRVGGLLHPALAHRIGGTPRLPHLFVSRPFQVFVLQYRPAVPFPHLVQAVLREVAVDHRQRTPQAVVQVARHQHRDSRLAAAAFLCGESHVQCLSVHIVILLVIHPAARAAASLFTQSVSLSATLPFIRSDIRSYIQPGIRLSACLAVQPFDRLAV